MRVLPGCTGRVLTVDGTEELHHAGRSTCPIHEAAYSLYRGDARIETDVDYYAAVSWFIHSAGESDTETQSAYYASVREAVRNGYCSDHRASSVAVTVIVQRVSQ